MSYTIENLKFTIFGHGHDVTRNDSGKGIITHDTNIPAYCGVIDTTNTYMWLCTDSGLKKYSISSCEEIEQTTIPASCNIVYHPNNVNNNYGIACESGTTAYIFDLTDDTLIGIVSGTFPNGTGFRSYDCILVNNKIYFTSTHIGLRSNVVLNCIDLTDLSFSSSTIFGNVSVNGFINNSSVYSIYPAEWFYQTSCAYSVALDGSTIWSNTGIHQNANIDAWGLTGNGKIYLPVQFDGVWHYGVFDGTSNPTFNPVTPNRIFGEFDNRPSLAHSNYSNRHDVQYNNGRSKACLMTTQGLLLTDFQTIDVLDSISAVPLAVSDRYAICSDTTNNYLHVYGI